MIVLGTADSIALAKVLADPPEPTKALLEAAVRYRAKRTSKDVAESIERIAEQTSNATD
jgi:metal-dependent amidase/aminoacylase/carboxypeptidase family protein